MDIDNTHPADPAAELDTALPFTHVDTQAIIQYDQRASDLLGRDYWRLISAIKFYVGDPKDNVWVLVPEGYLTDGATVSRLLYWLVPPWGRHGHATVIHDYLCEHLALRHGFDTLDISRKKADQIFNEAMKVTNVNPIIRTLMYAGVTLYRWFSKKNRYQESPVMVIEKRRLETEWREDQAA